MTFDPKLKRRDVLRGALATAGVAGLPALGALNGCAAPAEEIWLNDIHSKLNRTRVAKLLRPKSAEEVAAIVGEATAQSAELSVAGGYHAMGGQQLGTDTWHLDMRDFPAAIELDNERGVVRAPAGIQWPELMQALEAAQAGDPQPFGIIQKQTGADRLSLGGALAAAAHGRGLTLAPICADIEALDLVDASGAVRRISRESEAELFRLTLGGYGLSGIVTSVDLRLARRQKLERVVEVMEADDLIDAFDKRIAEGYRYGDFQYATDRGSGDVLRKGVFSCYRPVDPATPIHKARRLEQEDWLNLLVLAHNAPSQAFDRYAEFYLGTSGQIYASDTHQISTYLDDYHETLVKPLAELATGTEMISELYVPRSKLADFLSVVREDFIEKDVPLIYGTIRLIEPDTDALLAWAREPWACVIANLHTQHDEASLEATAGHFRKLIDRALSFGGSYFPTYHRWANREQVLAAHPRFPEFLAQKKAVDPEERFTSDWYRHHRDLLS